MSGFPDPRWLSVLKNLPIGILVGLFLVCIATLFLDAEGIISLQAFGWPPARDAVLIAATAFGILAITLIIGERLSTRRKRTLLSKRRGIRRDERKQAFDERKITILKRLDYLSREEIHYVANQLRKNEQSFLAYRESGPLANMIAKGLVQTPGTVHHTDHYPFSFVDFVWEALIERRSEFIQKDDDHKRREQEEKRRKSDQYRR